MQGVWARLSVVKQPTKNIFVFIHYSPQKKELDASLMKGYEDQTKQHTAFALKQSGQNPEAFAGISLGTLYLRRFTPLLLSLCFLWSIRPAPAGESEWVLSQMHAEFGRYKIYVANEAIKIVNQSLGYEVVA